MIIISQCEKCVMTAFVSLSLSLSSFSTATTEYIIHVRMDNTAGGRLIYNIREIRATESSVYIYYIL